MKLILFSCLSLQEFVETLQSCVSVSVLADLSSLHGLHDLSVLPHGLLASHHHLLLHPHLPAGSTTNSCFIYCAWGSLWIYILWLVIQLNNIQTLPSVTLRFLALCWSTFFSWWRSFVRLQWRTWMKLSTVSMGPTDCWSSWWVSHMHTWYTAS